MLGTTGLLVGAAPKRLRAECPPSSPSASLRAAANDNRAPAGKMRAGVLSVRLVARAATWFPDGPVGCGLAVHAFAEDGKPPQIPGPIIRVRAGAEVSVTIRNDLDKALWIRGLQDHNRGSVDSTELAPRAEHEFRFRATAPGAWYYWAGDVNARAPISNQDGQLVGALVVDPAAPQETIGDRIFVMTRWTPNGELGTGTFQLNAINGLSWPQTERVSYTVGDSIRWAVINGTDELHMMHLHGFYFRVESRGDAAHDSVLALEQKHLRVTAATRRGEWMSFSWSPDRPGNWLFHCHLVAHMSADQRLDRMPGTPASGQQPMHGAHTNHADDAMAGLIIGINIRPRGSVTQTATGVAGRRSMQLFADTKPNVFGDRPGFGFVLQSDAHAPAPDSIRIPGSPLILTQNEPVQITVHNRLSTPFGVHWHGIEIESYFDGVVGWSGSGRRIAPPIAPGDSFVARLTPPRAGSFIYHVHSEEGNELASGLYGPLIVLPPGQRFDPTTDLIFVIATAGPGPDGPPFVNGTAAPDTISLRTGTTYRLRLIDIAS
ncbi:MAG: multicopper oxidase domain-containing protein, partial [Gemmatimonadaceae bacterium]